MLKEAMIMGRKIKLTWPQLEISAKMELEDEKNKELCDDLWDNLPFESVQEHGMVSGKIIYTWVPTVSFSPVRFSELHSEAQVGRVFYSQGTGNKVIINYGDVNEDCLAPVLGMVEEEYHDEIKKIGKIIWDNYLQDKTIYTVKFERGE